MVHRSFARRLAQLLQSFPIVTILGPRQCGKTTFARQALRSWRYLDLEKPSDFVPLAEDPEAALKRLGGRFVLDEAQRLPALFPILRSYVDERRSRNGQAVLLGSVSPALVRQISESLAGRTGFLEMTPFLWEEVRRRESGHGVRLALWERGGFPKAYLASSWPKRLDWFEAYTRTFIERDLSALGIGVSAPQMRKLWTMLAHFNGQIWSASHLAAALGVSYHTVNRYTDILEHSFLIRKLQPYYVNIGKRLVKSPKLYFRDCGLLHYFLGLRRAGELDVNPARGASWEGFVIEQVLGALLGRIPALEAFYWRTAAGAEVDLVLRHGSRLIPLEIKLHSSPTRHDAGGLSACMTDLKLSKGYILYPGETNYSLGGGIRVLSVKRLLDEPQGLFSEKETPFDERSRKRGG